MEIAEEYVNDVIVVRLQGQLDSNTAQSARERFARLGTAFCPRIAIDLSKLSYISSVGLQAVLVLAKKIQQSKGKIVLFGVLPDVGEVLSISGLDKILTVRPDKDSAVAALYGG
jgi:anti-anti-sigma factor